MIDLINQHLLKLKSELHATASFMTYDQWIWPTLNSVEKYIAEDERLYFENDIFKVGRSAQFALDNASSKNSHPYHSSQIEALYYD